MRILALFFNLCPRCGTRTRKFFGVRYIGNQRRTFRRICDDCGWRGK
jgi:predicted RNA-binding Zn-ribbon protein involved in translation (DUF1610 family)